MGKNCKLNKTFGKKSFFLTTKILYRQIHTPNWSLKFSRYLRFPVIWMQDKRDFTVYLISRRDFDTNPLVNKEIASVHP